MHVFLCPSVSCSGCHLLVLNMYLFEQLDDPNLGACGFSRTGTWEVNVMSTYGVLAGMDSWLKLEEM